MAPVRNARVIFNERPEGKTTVYDGSKTIDLETVKLNGGILVKTLFLSIDPNIRAKMTSLYVKGHPLVHFGIGVVLRSENSAFRAGNHVYGYLNFEEYNINPNLAHLQVIQK